jgi:hypothetical protein
MNVFDRGFRGFHEWEGLKSHPAQFAGVADRLANKSSSSISHLRST